MVVKIKGVHMHALLRSPSALVYQPHAIKHCVRGLGHRLQSITTHLAYPTIHADASLTSRSHRYIHTYCCDKLKRTPLQQPQPCIRQTYRTYGSDSSNSSSSDKTGTRTQPQSVSAKHEPEPLLSRFDSVVRVQKEEPLETQDNLVKDVYARMFGSGITAVSGNILSKPNTVPRQKRTKRVSSARGGALGRKGSSANPSASMRAHASVNPNPDQTLNEDLSVFIHDMLQRGKARSPTTVHKAGTNTAVSKAGTVGGLDKAHDHSASVAEQAVEQSTSSSELDGDRVPGAELKSQLESSRAAAKEKDKELKLVGWKPAVSGDTPNEGVVLESFESALELLKSQIGGIAGAKNAEEIVAPATIEIETDKQAQDVASTTSDTLRKLEQIQLDRSQKKLRLSLGPMLEKYNLALKRFRATDPRDRANMYVLPDYSLEEHIDIAIAHLKWYDAKTARNIVYELSNAKTFLRLPEIIRGWHLSPQITQRLLKLTQMLAERDFMLVGMLHEALVDVYGMKFYNVQRPMDSMELASLMVEAMVKGSELDRAIRAYKVATKLNVYPKARTYDLFIPAVEQQIQDCVSSGNNKAAHQFHATLKHLYTDMLTQRIPLSVHTIPHSFKPNWGSAERLRLLSEGYGTILEGGAGRKGASEDVIPHEVPSYVHAVGLYQLAQTEFYRDAREWFNALMVSVRREHVANGVKYRTLQEHARISSLDGVSSDTHTWVDAAIAGQDLSAEGSESVPTFGPVDVHAHAARAQVLEDAHIRTGCGEYCSGGQQEAQASLQAQLAKHTKYRPEMDLVTHACTAYATAFALPHKGVGGELHLSSLRWQYGYEMVRSMAHVGLCVPVRAAEAVMRDCVGAGVWPRALEVYHVITSQRRDVAFYSAVLMRAQPTAPADTLRNTNDVRVINDDGSQDEYGMRMVDMALVACREGNTPALAEKVLNAALSYNDGVVRADHAVECADRADEKTGTQAHKYVYRGLPELSVSDHTYATVIAAWGAVGDWQGAVRTYMDTRACVPDNRSRERGPLTRTQKEHTENSTPEQTRTRRLSPGSDRLASLALLRVVATCGQWEYALGFSERMFKGVDTLFDSIKHAQAYANKEAEQGTDTRASSTADVNHLFFNQEYIYPLPPHLTGNVRVPEDGKLALDIASMGVVLRALDMSSSTDSDHHTHANAHGNRTALRYEDALWALLDGKHTAKLQANPFPRPDGLFFNDAMYRLGRRGAWRDAVRLFRYMRTKGVAVTRQQYGITQAAVCGLSEWKTCVYKHAQTGEPWGKFDPKVWNRRYVETFLAYGVPLGSAANREGVDARADSDLVTRLRESDALFEAMIKENWAVMDYAPLQFLRRAHRGVYDLHFMGVEEALAAVRYVMRNYQTVKAGTWAGIGHTHSTKEDDGLYDKFGRGLAYESARARSSSGAVITGPAATSTLPTRADETPCGLWFERDERDFWRQKEKALGFASDILVKHADREWAAVGEIKFVVGGKVDSGCSSVLGGVVQHCLLSLGVPSKAGWTAMELKHWTLQQPLVTVRLEDIQRCGERLADAK
ncbi:hypothetical protein SARC_04618 [Sphaeroforma arctica JP610]|uniref:Pentacotripeptide-repeat region of PRORP domain-containing protein n=1 Tax=Sphaeroforma arctica JP610 TaxID=667725 RepID=A0A0L0G222_9EUKA|nr:hypothetical protein SARC_04618 [Sphaeroforma arctica JP610]KNC83120.1 hypothetical protein SARC_04618 [Sphaeroforma arctica JP610]|eukprot:XP_014157022.1 hypothetical protein SARC_04618 [Sphaeroforma arctica JP610]